MESQAPKPFSIADRIKSFGFAFKGIATAVKTAHNFRIHLAALVLVVAAGWFLGLSATEWCLVFLASAMVMSMELMNSAAEFIVDMISPGYNEKAGMIKDLAAAAVLVSAIFAAVIGCIIFGSHLYTYFSK